MKIRVMLADDQTLVRQGICSLLELSDRVEVVGQVEDGSQVVAGVQNCQPDVLLLDIRMPKMNGIEALQAMNDSGRMVPTVILTTFDDHELVLQGLRAGARGFLLKDVSLESLVHAIERVHAGETLVQPAITERILKGLSGLSAEKEKGSGDENSGDTALAEALTPRELEVLRLMAGGYSNREISQALCRSEGTIKNQVSAILDKLTVRGRTQAVLRAINLGIL